LAPSSSEPALPDIRPFRERISDLALDSFETLEGANEALYQAGLGDGLPLVPPTSSRIQAMLASCSEAPDAPLETIMPSFVAPTLWDVATCAVIAGCEARYLPVIVAALRAVADPSFNLLGVQTTTGAAAPLIIVNGPIVEELAINAGTNVLGQGARANATIGRAFRLVLQDVGLAIPGSGDMATHGHAGKYGWCIAENEAGSPWPPIHVDRGFDRATSTVTAVGAVGSAEVVLSVGSPEALVTTLAHSMTLAGNRGAGGTLGSGQALVLLPPESARKLSEAGWDRARLQQALLAEARLPSQWLEGGTVDQDDVSVARSAADILIVVTGGVGIKATFVPTWGGGTEAVTREIKPL
jgi:hypothetical protein